MIATRHLVSLGMLCSLAAVSACSSQAPAPSPASTPATSATGAAKTVDAANAGVITGKVSFKGTPPARETVRMVADPACAEGTNGKQLSESAIVSADGAIANVFVYVKDGLDGYTFDTPKDPVVLDQRGCHYIPHVFGVRAGQPVEFLNSDATLHNVHAMPMNNAEFNRGEPVQGTRIRQTFDKPEIMVPIKCNVHPWMSAFAGVMAHPFFAVTAADGTFTLKGLPPGTYTVEAWHETFGSQTQQVIVGPKQTQTIALTFAAK